MRSKIQLLLSFLTLIGACQTLMAQPADGCYLATHPIVIRGDTPTDEDQIIPALEYFGLQKESKTTYKFDLFVVGDYNHICEATGRLETKKKNSHVILELITDDNFLQRQPQGERLCKMSVEQKSGTIIVNANDACNSQFACGVRAGIYKRHFESNNTTERAKPPCFQTP